jgi:hypothetical protein
MVFRPGGIVTATRRTYQFKGKGQAPDQPGTEAIIPG